MRLAVADGRVRMSGIEPRSRTALGTSTGPLSEECAQGFRAGKPSGRPRLGSEWRADGTPAKSPGSFVVSSFLVLGGKHE